MLDHGLSNVMDVIKRQKWESLLQRRELVHTNVVKEFYAKLKMSHNRKKDVAKSKLASILGIPGNNGICEYIKEGESGLDDQFYDPQVDVEEPVIETPDAPAVPASPEQILVQQRETTPSGVDPSCPSSRIPEAVMNKLQAEFERARANRIQADMEKAQAQNARLLSMLQQAQFKSKP
ncbi:hypothetical protein Dimus_028804 [Dionaea muscipula]